jgi:hypothetical protein
MPPAEDAIVPKAGPEEPAADAATARDAIAAQMSSERTNATILL